MPATSSTPEIGDADQHPAVAAMVAEMARIPAVERILLFGSRARGDHDPCSDIDLAVLCPEADLETWAAIWNITDEAPTLLAVDLVRLDQVSPGLRAEIEREGLVLHERQ